MAPADDLQARIDQLNSKLRAIAQEYGLDASALLSAPPRSDVSSGEWKVDVSVSTRGGSAPLVCGAVFTLRQWDLGGDVIFERFVREEAAAKLNKRR